MMVDGARDRLVLAIGLLAVKPALLAGLGPAYMPDSGGYDLLADFIASGRIATVDMTQVIPIELFRIAGLPAIVAVLKAVGGSSWTWLLVILQIMVSIAATLVVHATARSFGLGRWLALAVALAYATSLPLLLDQAVLTDSLYTSAVTVLGCRLAGRAASGRGLTAVSALALGLLLAAAFLLREATTFFAIGIAPLAFMAAVSGQSWSRGSVLRAVALTALLLAPLLATHRAYVEWNRVRVGVPVVTTGGQTNMIYALAKAAKHDPSVFDRDTPVDAASRAVFRTHEFHEVIAVNQKLFADYGLDAIAIQQAGYAAYFDAWKRHPMAMLAVPLNHIRSNQFQMALRPVESLRELALWTIGRDTGFARWRAVKEGQWWMAPLVAVDGLSKAVATLVFAGFALLTPWRVLRGEVGRPEVQASLGLWLFYFAMLGAYALVHLETRYMAPVVAGSIIVGAANFSWLAGRWKHRRRGQTNGL